MIRATMLGSAGSRPIISRELTALYTAVDGIGVLFDCGEGTQVSINKAGERIFLIDVICLTHSHADHVLGLPGLLLSIDQILKVDRNGEKKDIVLVAPKNARWVVNHLLKSVSLTAINLVFVWLDKPQETLAFPKFTIKAYKLSHSIDCYGFSIMEKVCPKFCKEKAELLPLQPEAYKFLQQGHLILCEDDVFTIQDISDREKIGAKVSYVVDTSVCDAIKDCIQDANLAVMEGMYPRRSDLSESARKYHMTFEDSAKLAAEGNVKELCLTHFSQSLANPNAALDAAFEWFENTTCGFCGLTRDYISVTV